MPTSTPTPMYLPGPPSDNYGGCIVREEQHSYGDDLVTGAVMTVYNRYSERASVQRDFAGERPDGIWDQMLFTYAGGWQIKREDNYRGYPLEMVERVDYEYAADRSWVRRSVDSNGDGQFDRSEMDTYDNGGRLLRREFDGHVWTYEYDLKGRLQWERIDFGGDGRVDVSIINTWNDVLVTRRGFDDTGDSTPEYWVDLTYDSAGRLTRAPYPDYTVTYDYTSEGWLRESKQFVGDAWEDSVSYEYDALGHLTRRSYESHIGDREFMVYHTRCLCP